LSVGFQKRKAIAFNYNSHEIRGRRQKYLVGRGIDNCHRDRYFPK